MTTLVGNVSRDPIPRRSLFRGHLRCISFSGARRGPRPRTFQGLPLDSSSLIPPRHLWPLFCLSPETPVGYTSPGSGPGTVSDCRPVEFLPRVDWPGDPDLHYPKPRIRDTERKKSLREGVDSFFFRNREVQWVGSGSESLRVYRTSVLPLPGRGWVSTPPLYF